MEVNKIYNEDCLDGLKKLPDESVDLVITDPPYKVTSRGSAGNSGGMLQKDINRKGQVFKDNDIDIKDWISEIYRILKDGSHCYIMTNHINLKNYLNIVEQEGFHFIKNLIWNKGNKIMGQYYMSQYEYIMFLRKGRGQGINNCGTSDILNIENKKIKQNEENIHDTEKPVELAKVLIENSSKKGDIVVDPFVGVGWVALASKILNRDFICWEINEEYYKWCYRRLGRIDSEYYNQLSEEDRPKQQQLI